MPWQELKPMDQRILFIADHLRDLCSFSELCRRYGISRKTGYKWVQRYGSHDLEGLADRGRRPHNSPQRVPYIVRQAVLSLRRHGTLVLGPKKIQALLAQRFPGIPLPSKTTIYNILNTAGLIEPRRRRTRVPTIASPLASAVGPNDIWSADFKGQFLLGNRQWCYPLTVMDQESRYLIGCHGLKSTAADGAQTVFERWFREYGLPQRIRTDNGVPFATRSAGGLSRLAVWWIRLGIVPERIEPGRPQQNGRHERMHRTLKKAVTSPAKASFKSQQRQFDAFKHDYNDERPHESLDLATPSSRYTSSLRPFPDRLPELEYPGHYQLRKVGSAGVIYIQNQQAYLSYLLADQTVALEAIDEDCWDVHFGPIRIGRLDAGRPSIKSQRKEYLTLKV